MNRHRYPLRPASFAKIALILFLFASSFLPKSAHSVDASPSGPTQPSVYLPLVVNGSWGGFSTTSKLAGVYMQQYWTNDSVATYMTQADSLAGKKHTVSGWFIDLQDVAFTNRQPSLTYNNFYNQLEALWNGGYISFVNLMSASSPSAWAVTDNCVIPFNSYQFANGSCDRAIDRMADIYASWISLGGGRKAFLAPLPEMNGVNSDGSKWTPYAGDAANFKLAYQRILNRFAAKGIQSSQVWWTFAPNGWSTTAHKFENYYPGDALVDVNSFSSYNFGYCQYAGSAKRWENYDTLYQPYINRMSVMASSKPIIIAQTGTTAEYSYTGEVNVARKNTWLQSNYAWLAGQPQVLGILYFDIDKSSWECNWRINPGNTYTGYTAGLGAPAYRYLTTQDLNTIIP